MGKLEIHQIPVLSDNYAYLVHDPAGGATAVIDPSEGDPVLDALKAKGWRATHLFNTHHHYDHVDGNLRVKEQTGCRVVGSRVDAEKIPGLDERVGDGDRLMVGTAPVTVIQIPGHTRGHVAWWFREHGAVFTGDTLFTLGCGRMFEGTAAQMWSSLCRLRDLPEDTRVYCGHEYTQKNARFALTVDPENRELRARAERTDALRAEGKPTVPATLGEERRTNPFLRADCAPVQQSIGLAGRDPVEVFAEIRRRKDRY